MAVSRRLTSWISIVIVAGGYAAFLTTSVSIDFGFDAMIHVEQSLRYSEDWAFFTADHYDQSPPLRYVPYTFLINVFQPGSYASAFRIATAYAAVATFVGGGIVSYELGRAWTDDSSHLLGVLACLGFFATAVVWPENRFMSGKWQYTTTFPLLVLSLLVAVRALRADRSRELRWAVATGAVLGILGLQQLIFAGVASLAIGITFLAYRRYRPVVLVGGTGAAFAALLLFGQNEARRRATNSIAKRFMPESGPLTLDIGALVSPGVLLIIFLLGTALVTSYLVDDRRYVTTVTSATVAVTGVVWGITKATTAQDYLTVSVLHPMVFLAGVVVLGRTFTLYSEFDGTITSVTNRIRS